jgi:hypothetical protein
VGTRGLLNFEGTWEIETSLGEVWHLIHPGGLLNRIAGVGISPAIFASQKAPGQHGESHLGYVLDVRTVQMGFDLDGTGGNQECLVEVREDNPYLHLNYLVNPLKIRRRLPSKVRELWDVWYVGGVERDSDSVSVPPTVEGLAMQFVVKDPVWYDPTLNSYAVTVDSGASGDELVFDTPAGVGAPTAIFSTADYLTFGSSSINLSLTAGEITNAGDWPTFPTITIVGPASYPEIENLTSGHLITLDYDIPIGRTVTFDLTYGNKTVRDDLGTNLAGLVPSTDDLADFCLWGTRQVAGGANDIRLFCGGATGATSITIAWYDRYLAI